MAMALRSAGAGPGDLAPGRRELTEMGAAWLAKLL